MRRKRPCGALDVCMVLGLDEGIAIFLAARFVIEGNDSDRVEALPLGDAVAQVATCLRKLSDGAGGAVGEDEKRCSP